MSKTATRPSAKTVKHSKPTAPCGEGHGRANCPVDPSAVKVGDLMAFTYYGRIKSVSLSGSVLSVDCVDSGIGTFDVSGDVLIRSSASADYFAREEKVNGTQAIDLLASSYNRPLSVFFTKENGEERLLRGRLVDLDRFRGRCLVEDLDLPSSGAKSRLRWVDNRTLQWLVVDGIKYTVK